MSERRAICPLACLAFAAAGLWALVGSLAYAQVNSGATDPVRIPLASSLDTTFAADAGGGPEPKPRMEIYGFAMLDMGYDFKQVNPDWFDVLRPTKLPSFSERVRRERQLLGERAADPLRRSRAICRRSWGEVKTDFEFELFGVRRGRGADDHPPAPGLGRARLPSAPGRRSVFMDRDVFPNSVEYWGPTGMVFFRNVQLRWTPMQGDNELAIALERPGASGDQGRFCRPHRAAEHPGALPAPDFTAHFKRCGDWGHVQLAGIVRYIGWTDTLQDQFNLRATPSAGAST